MIERENGGVMERQRNGGMTLWQKKRDGEEENDWRGKREKRTAIVENLSERQMLKIGLIGL